LPSARNPSRPNSRRRSNARLPEQFGRQGIESGPRRGAHGPAGSGDEQPSLVGE
jgi:hypothetical protein